MITEISALRVNNVDGMEITNLILHFIYATLFIVMETRARERRRLLDRPCNYACIKIYEGF